MGSTAAVLILAAHNGQRNFDYSSTWSLPMPAHYGIRIPPAISAMTT
jgi:hypothetical protein